MIRDQELDEVIRAFLADEGREMARTAPTLDSAAARLATRVSRPGSWTSVLRPGWRFPSINRVVPFAVAGLVLVVALIAVSIFGRPPNVGPPSTTPPPLPSATASPSTAAAAGTWTAIASMLEGREGHAATLLSDGRVLVAGGSETTRSELYDPATGAWAASGDMVEARQGHTATLLPDGRVLVVGGVRPGFDENGVGGNIALASAELYDPATRSWTATGNMLDTHGRGHTATLLPNGSVLIAGGYPAGSMLASAELYDPATDSWTATGSMLLARGYHTATLLPDGTVLVAGSLTSGRFAELYDPITGSWTETGSMVHGRHDFTATLLLDGTVLASGYEGSSTTELYDPGTGTWTETGSMIDVRLGTYWATLLRDGRVLATGGVPNRHAVVELYDPGTGKWARAADTNENRQYHTATLLPDGTVLVTGGRGGLASAELYEPGE